MSLSQMAFAEIHLGLEEVDGCEVILKHIYHQRVSERKIADREVAKKISREVGGLPILVSQFAGFASHSHCSLMELLNLLQEPSSFQLIWNYDSRDSSTFQYGAPMSKVWGLALQELSPEASQTLRLLTMLSPDGVPEAMLIGDWTEPDLAYLRPERRFGFFGVRQSLSTSHLVEINNSTGILTSLSMHRSLRSYLVEPMSESIGSVLLQQNFDTAAVIVRRSFPPQTVTQTPSNHNWNISKEYLPQILSLQSFYSSWKLRVQPSKTFASLLADAGVDRTQREKACSSPVEKAFQLRKRQLQILTQSGKATQADHLLLANGWNDLGVLLMQNEEFEAAQDRLEKSIVIKEQWITEEEEPANFGESFKNLAYIRIHQNQNDEAVATAKRACTLIEHAYGPDAQATLKGSFVYGCNLLAVGDLEAAKKIHKNTLARRRRLLGEKSFITKDSIYVLGEIYCLSGRMEKAENMFREMLDGAHEAGCGCVKTTKDLLASSADMELGNKPWQGPSIIC
ncbi:uncharacterized protein RAG0_16588 [Rhynchosporium agropyri]|uniref:DUF7779 domain-containing protein n=1 Tax=Rhynchosporium agropyri TaxID=914238 RepID=A0A1E1LR20_9HELO|nr:uncharacterized protein RAG0_16588 [Rhynchosporium agropyri]